MIEITEEDFQILEDALSDAIQFARDKQDDVEYLNKKVLYFNLYNKLFVVDNNN